MLRKGNARGAFNPKISLNLSTKVRFVHEGQVYDDPDQMPPEVRARYDQAMSQIDKDGNGVPDFLEGKGFPAAEAVDTARGQNVFAQSAPVALIDSRQHTPATITPDRANNRWILVASLTILFLFFVILGLVLYIYFR